MARLTGRELRARLAFDREVVDGLRAPWLRTLAANSADDARAGRSAPARAEVRAFRVDYQFPILTGPGTTTRNVALVFDLLAGGDYPYSPPHVQADSWPMPWSPHVHPRSGVVCIGGIWEMARGRMLLAQLIVHLARVLNLDEERGHAGWNHEAYAYWRDTLGHRPVNPSLVYPSLPIDVTHGGEEESRGRLRLHGAARPGLRIVGRRS